MRKEECGDYNKEEVDGEYVDMQHGGARRARGSKK